MRTIGLIGGMSWESTLSYYRIINQAVNDRLGGLHSARLVLYSVEFQELERLQHAGAWDEACEILVDAACALQSAGADFLAICSNTMHKVAGELQCRVSLPLLHIADATAEAVNALNLRRVGLLGTRFTMEEDFYRDRLKERHGLEVLCPGDDDRNTVHRVIFDELCQGQVHAASALKYKEIIERLVERGAEGVILGCTEISMLVKTADAAVPLFDTTDIHARAVAHRAMHEESPVSVS